MHKHWGGFTASCDECTLRELALSPGFFFSRRLGRLRPEYMRALQMRFGPEWKQWHERVKAKWQELENQQGKLL